MIEFEFARFVFKTVKGRVEQTRVRNELLKSSGMCNLNYTTEVITMAAFRHIVIFLLFSPFLFYSCDSVNSNSGSAIAWTRIINGEVTTFGVSGLIHKNNLIAYDRATETQWSQMMELGVNGELIGERPESHKIIEMNWKTWKTIFPNSKVLSGRIGFDRNYSLYPYGRNYASDNNNLLFPIHLEDDRLERKTLAHGVFYDKNLHVFPVESFPDTVVVLNRIIAGNEIVVAGSSGHELVVSFSSKAGDGTVLRFSASGEELPVIMGDEEGNLWNVFGECVAGPRSGEKLKRIPSYNAYWFAWVDFFGDGLRAPIIVFP